MSSKFTRTDDDDEDRIIIKELPLEAILSNSSLKPCPINTMRNAYYRQTSNRLS
jgi:hypothetical protein